MQKIIYVNEWMIHQTITPWSKLQVVRFFFQMMQDVIWYYFANEIYVK